jgi:hypothetical protein
MHTIQDELDRVGLGAAKTFRNLTIFPLLRPAPEKPAPFYLMLDDALKNGHVRVTEVTRGGSVPELALENKADKPVLLLDGEELVGAKQNRVLNLTILAAARSKTTIPVSCVEQGRWRAVSPEFEASPCVQFAAGRALKVASVTAAMLGFGSRRSDQCEVWDAVSEKASRLGADSPTGAMSDIFEKHAARIEEYLRSFDVQERQCGMLFALGGRVMGFDLLDHPAAFAAASPKLLRSYALDALDAGGADASADEAAARRFLATAQHADFFTEPAIGVGMDVRIRGMEIAGGALWAEERYVHIYGFRLNGSGHAGQTAGARMSRPSARRVC